MIVPMWPGKSSLSFEAASFSAGGPSDACEPEDEGGRVKPIPDGQGAIQLVEYDFESPSRQTEARVHHQHS